MFKFNATIVGLLASTLAAGIAFAKTDNTKINIYIDLDANAKNAHKQLQALKNMDVIGVNLKKHWAEVAVTKEELKQLQTLNLIIRKAKHSFTLSDEYLNPEQVVQALEKIHGQYPAITKLFEFGKTHQQRPIMALEISAHLDNLDKPVVIFNAMHHAREVMTPEVVMHIANVLTEKYGQDSEITNWLDQYRIVLVPQVNPDGNSFVSAGQTMWRKNAYELRGEVVGVDINRNYPAYWNYCDGSDSNPRGEAYRGPSAGSEPETVAMMNLVNTYKPVAEISYHSYSEMILYPFGCSNVKNPSKALFHSIGQAMNAKILNDDNQTNQYEVGTVPELLYNADGGDIDWLWKEQGVLAFGIEVNSSNFHPNYKKWRNVTVKRQEGGWQALIRRMSQSGFRAHVQTSTPNEVSYSIKKIEGNQKLAFDGDAPERTFPLRSTNGLLYQLTEKGRYEVTFFVKNQSVKSITIQVGETLVDLGDIPLA